ncbi:putative MFS general substrate transporter [Lyophyllum shimeji]|uniref:MFS general substrate transporter n=1 Tax=Lyophyllum shimeji TaxID=47721 RepID=A0A9P3URS1_LYOSH|nr:putative MFS general substrate transporter [Lyophyllum shimeji]
MTDSRSLESKHELDAKTSPSAEYDINRDAETKLVRKLDIILLPMFAVAYCTNFIDRTAIGNAKIAGIEKDLRMSGFEYNIALTVFYIFYVAVDIPSNLALKRFGSPWIAAMITAFGIVSIGTAFVKSYTGLIVTRVFLGLAEGGTLSGLTYMLSRYYRRKELVFRIGLFFGTSTPIAGAFGGLLASGLLSVKDFGMVKSWRKIFLIEGIITTGFGLLCFLILPADPQRTRMLNEEERALALARIDADQAVKTQGRRERATFALVLRSFSFHTILCTVIYVMLNISFQGLSLFMPTVVATLGHYTVVQSQLRTVPPYVVAAVWAVVCTYFSYRTRRRAAVILACALFMVAGYAIAVGTKNSHARYAACFLTLAGASPAGPLVLAWGADNAAPDTVRAVATALIPGVGALGSVIAVWTYLPADAPNYHNGNTLNLSTSCATCLLTGIGFLYLRHENAKRDQGKRDHRLQGKTPSEIEQLGYLHPNFRYLV